MRSAQKRPEVILMNIQHGKSEAVTRMAEALGVPRYLTRFCVNVARGDVVIVDCEYAVSAEDNAQIIKGKYRLEKME